MRVLAVLVGVVVVGGVVGVSDPRFRYAYSFPAQPDDTQDDRTQFAKRSGPSYNFRYQVPSHGHYNPYVNPIGTPLLWQYPGHPNVGFPVNVDSAQTLPKPVVPVGGSTVYTIPQGRPQAVVPPEQQVGSPSLVVEDPEDDDSLTPLLKQAAADGQVVQYGTSISGTPQYAVSPQLAAEAGGVSALAYKLGAVPVAAVHDVQVRPSPFRESHSAFAPVLVHQEQPAITLYTLEVPNQ